MDESCLGMVELLLHPFSAPLTRRNLPRRGGVALGGSVRGGCGHGRGLVRGRGPTVVQVVDVHGGL